MDRQHRVAERATAHGFAVLALRGKVGECITSPELATWFCWPSNEHTASDAPAFVASWAPALRAAEQRTGAGGKRFVLGFSNGAYFSGLLAVGAHFGASAFAVANGGTVEPVHAAGAKPPIILLSADSDESQPGMIQFDAELTREQWPHEVYARAGGHALQNEDIDAVLSFFVRSQVEKVPLSPPITTHRPQPHVATPDAAEAEIPTGDSTPNRDPSANPY
jgi:predicted esterase